MNNSIRELAFVTSGQIGSDGDGVKLTRLIGTADLDMIDPFLLFDSFESDQANDYIGGFPSHPHRGFETVTYMINGKVRHKDSMGNEGVIEPNGVQWMTAGKGVVHSEMPEQQHGLLRGLQLWVNLPKTHKMTEPAYQEFDESKISTETTNGHTLNIVAGKTNLGTQGVIHNEHVQPTYLDVFLTGTEPFEQTLEENHNAFIYVISGEVSVGINQAKLGERQLGVLTKGKQVRVEVTNTNKDSRFLLVAAKPLNEPVARSGPFVMNSHKELRQAFDDFSNNRF